MLKKAVSIIILTVLIASMQPSALAAKFSLGDTIEVFNTGASGLVVRDAPAGNAIGKKYDGNRGMVLAGPQSASLGGVVYTWWKVRWGDNALEGWSAEGYPGGVDYLRYVYVSPSTKFSVGNLVKVSGGPTLIVRTDPPPSSDLSYKGSVADGTVGKVVGGPFYGVAQGVSGFYHFWKVDFLSIVGWSAEDWLANIGGPAITSSLVLAQSPPYYLGNTIAAGFTITNRATASFTFDVLTVGGRDPDNQVADFSWIRSITLSPGASYNYQGTLTLTKVGNYHFFCAYRTLWGDWNPNISTEGGATNTLDIYVNPTPPPPNQPPYTPSNPSPSNHGTGVSIYVDLSWSGGDPDAGDTVTYDVYFGVSPSPPLVSSSQSATTYDLGTLSYSTTYCWKIVAKDNHGASTVGPVWDFVTQTAPPPPNQPPYTPYNPSPSNHATAISIYADLSWSGGDPDAGDIVTYDVYFGTITPPPLVSNDQSATTYDLGTLSYGTTYYWKIVATDNQGASTEGPIWDFTTESAPQVTAAIDELLLNLIDQHANSYFNPAWDVTIDQCKAWIATIASGEGGKGGYVAHSQGVLGSDVFDHRGVGNNFRFSTGIGPFQLDNGGYDNWQYWPTIKKLNPEEAVKSVLNWHYRRFGAGVNLGYFADNSIWFAVKGANAADHWEAVTGTSWDAYKNGKVSLDWLSIKNQLSQNAQDLKFLRYETNVKNMGVMRWSIKESDGIKTDTGKKVVFDSDYQTWLITARNWNGIELFQYYYTFDQSRGIEVWAWNNFQDPANKFRYIFVREYTTGQFPEHRVSGVAGETLTSSAIVGMQVIAKSPVDLIVTDPEGITITKNVSEVPGMFYNEFDVDGDGDLDDVVTILYRKLGNYSIWVVPEPEATHTDTFTLVVSTQTETIILAENVAISEIPGEPYTFEYTHVLYTFSIVWGEQTFVVPIESNSTVSNFAFYQPDKEISFNVTGSAGTIGFCNVTIPKALLYGEPWTVLIDGAIVSTTNIENATHSILYFTYAHSTHKIQTIGTWVIEPPNLTCSYIRADGSVDPTTAPIQRNGDLYTFTGDINVSIVVERSNIIIDGSGYTLHGNGSGYGFYLFGINNVTVEKANVKDFGISVWLSNSSRCSLNENSITNNFHGIDLEYSSSNSIRGNHITRNDYGIYLWSSSDNNSISGNNVTNNNFGIWLDYSLGNSISGNNITNGSYGIHLVFSSSNSVSGNTFTDDGLLVEYSYQNSVENNTVNGKPLVYLEGVANYNVGDAGEVILVRCENVRIENLNLSSATVGVQLLETNDSDISGNHITNNFYPIYLYSSSNNSISGNIITNNDACIFLLSSSNNSISGNNITNNGFGIWLLYSSDNNSISGNIITDNFLGIGLDSSFSNKVYHNDFVHNTNQAFSENSVNIWDNGYEGNYWSDYIGPDLDKDGVGDTPYTVNSDNVDHCPLMNRYWNPADINHDLKVELKDVYAVAKAYGSSPGHPRWNSHCDINGDGIVDLKDYYAVCKNYGKTWT